MFSKQSNKVSYKLGVACAASLATFGLLTGCESVKSAYTAVEQKAISLVQPSSQSRDAAPTPQSPTVQYANGTGDAVPAADRNTNVATNSPGSSGEVAIQDRSASTPVQSDGTYLTATPRDTVIPDAPEASADDKALPVDAAWAKLFKELDDSRKPDFSTIWKAQIKARGFPITNATNASRQQARAAQAGLKGNLSLAAFQQTLNEVAAFLAKELPLDKTIAAAQNKQVLCIEGIENRSASKAQELGMALDQLPSSLVQSPAIMANFMVLSPTAGQYKQALDSAGAAKPWQVGNAVGAPGAPGMGDYHPATIYLVSGKFYQVTDERNHRMYLKTLVEVWRPLTGETIKAKEFTRGFRFHPYRMEWVPAEEDRAK